MHRRRCGACSPEPAADVSRSTSCTACPASAVDDRPWVGAVHDRQPRRHAPSSTAARAASATPPTAPCSAPCAGPPTSIIVGAGTVRQEGYGPPKQGRPAHRRGDLDRRRRPRRRELFTSGAGFLIMPEDGPRRRRPRAVRSTSCGPATGRVDLALALRRLDEVMDPPTFVQAEGGPRLNGSLLDADCVDELDLTVSPVARRRRRRRGSSTGAAPDAGRLRPRPPRRRRATSFLYGRWIAPA